MWVAPTGQYSAVSVVQHNVSATPTLIWAAIALIKPIIIGCDCSTMYKRLRLEMRDQRIGSGDETSHILARFDDGVLLLESHKYLATDGCCGCSQVMCICV